MEGMGFPGTVPTPPRPSLYHSNLLSPIPRPALTMLQDIRENPITRAYSHSYPFLEFLPYAHFPVHKIHITQSLSVDKRRKIIALLIYIQMNVYACKNFVTVNTHFREVKCCYTFLLELLECLNVLSTYVILCLSTFRF